MKHKTSFKFQVSGFMALLLSVFLFGIAQGAVLYLEPASGAYHQGDTFILQARIEIDGACINTVRADLTFPQDSLKVVDFSQGGSILNFWVTAPFIDESQGLISFSGGIPGGYCGRIPGDPGKSNLLGKIIFKVKEISGGQSSAQIRFLESSEVLLNDGLGTASSLATQGAVFDILPKSSGSVQGENEWQKELAQDQIPPEPFTIEINQTADLFEGKYFIIFSTIDRQTGLDHYEVKEGDKAWQTVEGLYLLKDQRLKNSISVKAIDKAGNDRVVEYTPIREKEFPWVFLLPIAIILLIIIYYYVRKNLPRSY